MQKWVYKNVEVKDVDRVNTVDILNEAGLDGWEFTGHVSDTGYALGYLMKRLLPEEKELKHLYLLFSDKPLCEELPLGPVQFTQVGSITCKACLSIARNTV